MSEYFAFISSLYSPTQKASITPDKLAHPSHLLARGSFEFCYDELVRQGYKPLLAGSRVFKGPHFSVLIVPIE